MAKRSKAKAEGGAAPGKVRTSSVSSTEAQNSLGEILGRVTGGERVFVTRYGRREAVILSAEAYGALLGDEPVDLEELEHEFDEMVERMQTPRHAAATHALFGMSEDELGEAAARPISEQPEGARQ
jgi:prevent-host-death family protein